MHSLTLVWVYPSSPSQNPKCTGSLQNVCLLCWSREEVQGSEWEFHQDLPWGSYDKQDFSCECTTTLFKLFIDGRCIKSLTMRFFSRPECWPKPPGFCVSQSHRWNVYKTHIMQTNLPQFGLPQTELLSEGLQEPWSRKRYTHLIHTSLCHWHVPVSPKSQLITSDKYLKTCLLRLTGILAQNWNEFI